MGECETPCAAPMRRDDDPFWDLLMGAPLALRRRGSA
jgi:hypothetical protein